MTINLGISSPKMTSAKYIHLLPVYNRTGTCILPWHYAIIIKLHFAVVSRCFCHFLLCPFIFIYTNMQNSWTIHVSLMLCDVCLDALSYGFYYFVLLSIPIRNTHKQYAVSLTIFDTSKILSIFDQWSHSFVTLLEKVDPYSFHITLFVSTH